MVLISVVERRPRTLQNTRRGSNHYSKGSSEATQSQTVVERRGEETLIENIELGAEIKVLEEEPLSASFKPKPNYDARKSEAWEEELHAFILLLSSLLIVAAAILARYTQNILIILPFLVGAAVVTVVQPYLGYDRWPTGYRLAEVLFKEGILEEWACYNDRIPFVAVLKNGVHLIVVLGRLGLKATLILTSSAGHVTLSTLNSNTRGIKMKKLRILKRASQEGWGLDGLKAVRVAGQSCIVELIVPSVRRKELLTMYKGKAVVIDVTSNPTIEIGPLDDIVIRLLERATEALYEPIGIPERRKSKVISVLKPKISIRSKITELRRRREARRKESLKEKRKEKRGDREAGERRHKIRERVLGRIVRMLPRRD
uniref:Uncharacterized protein n=1 Tax=Fervidicoccus fontis TaxID=683846 RepID=A0A7J3ZJX2_9CREN